MVYYQKLYNFGVVYNIELGAVAEILAAVPPPTFRKIDEFSEILI
jgi:hypothetical protein